jgi:hypothetical protein
VAACAAAIAVALPAAAQASPPNDTFPGQAIGGSEGLVQGTNVGATKQPSEPSYGSHTVWYSWTAPKTGKAKLNLRDASFDTALSVFTGTSVTSMSWVRSNDDFNGTLQSKLDFDAVAGTTYRIVVDGYSPAASGAFALQWSQGGADYDDFATPYNLPGAASELSFHNIRSTGEPGEPAIVSGAPPNRSAWFTWTAPETGTAVFSTQQTDFDTVLGVYTGASITALAPVAISDDANGTLQSRVKFPVVSGAVYRIAVDGYHLYDYGWFVLQYSVNPPANDDFTNPQLLPDASGATAATTIRATGEPGEALETGGLYVSNHSVWYRWTPAVSGPATVALLGVAPGFKADVTVYAGNSLATIAAVGTSTTSVAFNAVPGTEYRIRVDGRSDTSGSFTLQRTVGP